MIAIDNPINFALVYTDILLWKVSKIHRHNNTDLINASNFHKRNSISHCATLPKTIMIFIASVLFSVGFYQINHQKNLRNHLRTVILYFFFGVGTKVENTAFDGTKWKGEKLWNWKTFPFCFLCDKFKVSCYIVQHWHKLPISPQALLCGICPNWKQSKT